MLASSQASGYELFPAATLFALGAIVVGLALLIGPLGDGSRSRHWLARSGGLLVVGGLLHVLVLSTPVRGRAGPSFVEVQLCESAEDATSCIPTDDEIRVTCEGWNNTDAVAWDRRLVDGSRTGVFFRCDDL